MFIRYILIPIKEILEYGLSSCFMVLKKQYHKFNFA